MHTYNIYVYAYLYIYIIETVHGQDEVCDGCIAYVSIRQHTSAYVSIRQHTSAYVSIRQHTSAYVAYHIYSEDTYLVVCGSMRAHIYSSMRTGILQYADTDVGQDEVCGSMRTHF